MALLLRDGSIYLHVPKTGGNWLTSVLHRADLVTGALSSKHADVALCASLRKTKAIQKLAREIFLRRFCLKKPFQVIIVVRHPLRWAESWYKYQCGRGWIPFGREGSWSHCHPLSELNFLTEEPPESFNDFIERMIQRHPGFVGNLYAKYACGASTTIFRQETLADDARQFFCTPRWGLTAEQVGLFQLPREGISPSVAVELDDQLRLDFMRFEAATCQRFGYGQEGVR